MTERIEKKLYDAEKFESGICPSCNSEDVEKSHNMWNLALGGSAGIAAYFWDFPFKAKYHCNNCDSESE